MSRSVEISDELATDLERRIEETDFDSLREYVVFILGEVASDHPELGEIRRNTDGADESRARENLKSLGYLED